MTLERSTSFAEYEHIARAKTGSLFGWCTGTGAWLAGIDAFDQITRFGTDLGHAFQMADDFFDTFELDAAQAGVDELIQWVESAAPLPVVIAAEANPELAARWRKLASLLTEGNYGQLRAEITAVQNECRVASTLDRCVAVLNETLTRARQDLEATGGANGLSWALEVIAERALEGERLARDSSAG